jgi:flagellar motor switch protein FliN/FliY
MTTLEHIATVLDIPVQIETELDRKIMTVRQLLELEKGCIVKMMRSAGENIDVLAGGALLGYGEIVIIEDTVGVRITDFISEE